MIVVAPAGGSKRGPQHLRERHGPAPRALLHLLAAAEPVGDDNRIGRSRTHRRKKYQLSHLSRHVVVLRLEPEAAGHPAAPGVERRHVGVHSFEQLLFGDDSAERLLVAVSVKQDATWTIDPWSRGSMRLSAAIVPYTTPR